MQVPRGETRVSMPRTSDVRPWTKRGGYGDRMWVKLPLSGEAMRAVGFSRVLASPSSITVPVAWM